MKFKIGDKVWYDEQGFRRIGEVAIIIPGNGGFISGNKTAHYCLFTQTAAPNQGAYLKSTLVTYKASYPRGLFSSEPDLLTRPHTAWFDESDLELAVINPPLEYISITVTVGGIDEEECGGLRDL